MTKLERIRELTAQKKSEPPKEALNARPQREAVGYEPITVACGHELQFPVLERDKYEKERRAKWQKKLCPPCAAEKHRLHNEAHKAQRPKAAKKPRSRWSIPGRLPDGAHFDLIYHADTESWTGTLSVGEVLVANESTGVFKLLTCLDKMLRPKLVDTSSGRP